MSYNNFKYNMQKYAHIDPVTRNIIVPGNLYVEGSANIPGLQPVDIAPVSTTDIVGNILSGQYVSVSGNVKGKNLIGNGTFLENLTVEVPGNITADIVGNISGQKITLTGNIYTTTLIGNASKLLGVVVGFPTTGIADVRGNVFAPGNVNAVNVGASNFIVYGNAFTNTNTITGNIISSYFSGNGFFLTDVTQTFPSTAVIDIVGNVYAPANVDTTTLTAGNVIIANAFMNTVSITGNISSSYFSGNASNVTGVIPSSLNTNVFGNVYATGNVTAAYFNGNGQAVTLNGYTIVPRGNVANQIARLALTNALPGSIVFQTDANVTYILLGTPASSTSNWLQFTGANFPVTSVMGRTGNVLLLSNVDVKTIGGANIATSGSLTTANINIMGNVTGQNVTANVVTSGNVSTGTVKTDTMTVTGNVVVNYLVGNGMLLESVQLTIPRTANIDIVGNVVASANVDTQSITTTVMRAGNVISSGQVTVVGNVSAAYFVGNGATITGIPATGTQPINIIGNVFAPGNVNAANVSTGVIVAGNAIAVGQINTIGNVITNAFFVGSGAGLTNVPAIVTGTQNINITGNVISSGNVDASNMSTSILRAPNVIVTGQVNSIGNVVAGFFIGSGAQLSNVTATLGGTQVVDVIGNVVASANVDASNMSTSLLRVAGNINVLGQVNTLGNVVGSNFFGSGSGLTGVTTVATGNQNIDVIGNVAASGNVDASNVTSSILRVVGNGVVGGQVNVIGNVIASRLLGNGIFLSGIVATGNIFADVIGNVVAFGNVNTQNVVTSSLRTSSNCIVTGQVNVSGNIVADGGFVGDGSLLQGTTFGATGSPLPSFVPPVTGFTADVGNVIYSNTAGWTIPLQQYQSTNIGITTYNMPTNPDAPFVNLPSTVTQRLTSPWVFSNGVWTGNVNLFSTATFAAQPISMGYNSGYGVLGGNSSATNGTGIQMISLNGVFNITTSSGWRGDVWPNPATGNLWMFILPTSDTYILGQSFAAGQIYFLELTKNLNYLISWHRVSSTTALAAGTLNPANTTQTTNYYIVSATEAYLMFVFSNSNMNTQIYDTVCVPNIRSFTPFFLVRVNPTARTCQWATYIQTTQGSSLNFMNLLTVNPQRTILHLQSTLNTGGGVAANIVFGNSNGNLVTVLSTPVTAGIRFSAGMGIFPGNGVYIPNTLSGIYNDAYDGSLNFQYAQNSDRWSADGQVVYLGISTQGYQNMVFSTFNATSNTWTVRTTTPVNSSSTGIGFTAQPFVYRLPVGNVNSTWTGATITTNRSLTDFNARQPQLVSITPANNGNIFMFAISAATNTAITATSTWGTATTSVLSGVPYSPPQIFSFQDTNGTFSNYGASTGTSTTAAGRGFGGVNQWNGITSVKNPNSNTSVRVLSTCNYPDLTLNGVAAANLNTANTNFIPVMFDINSSLTISNFMGQLPITVGNNAVTAGSVTSPTIYFGPNADSTYHIVGLNAVGAAKMGNV
ncbi:Chlorovirus glycoprotein repeat domain-containing protein [Paramecium bursaria Chlorella virus MA1E]|nr:Chlorovirus glycoprotein repeat domain-containing protein [Paramecium bursaria Chlorella virus MA1E]